MGQFIPIKVGINCPTPVSWNFVLSSVCTPLRLSAAETINQNMHQGVHIARDT